MKTPFEPLNGYPEYPRYTAEQIRTVCMYCGDVLNNPGGIVDSHGICNSCAVTEAEKMDITIDGHGAAV